ncbi:MAG: BamA/TamA family outer membrane protein [Bacteroidota bacterium]
MITPSSIFYKIMASLIVAGCFLLPVVGQQIPSGRHALRIQLVDKDSSIALGPLNLKTDFSGSVQCIDYITKLPSLLATKGFPAASVDQVVPDSTFTTIRLYLGQAQKLVQLDVSSIESRALEFGGYSDKAYLNQPVDFGKLEKLKERILNYYENNGYPFASVVLDSIMLTDTAMQARLKVEKGLLYHVDSIRVKGKLRISNAFLQRYLGIPNGSIYDQSKIDVVGKQLLELPYLQEQQPAELTLLGTGSILDLYLAQKKSSQVNFLVGFLPANAQTNKLQFTGDVNLNLRNALGSGETILLNWQQLQLSSPRLNIGYQHPYIFRSAFGLDFAFDLFKKDSTFLQLNAQIGIQYLLSANQSGKIFFQNQSTVLLGSGVDTFQVKATRRLPANADTKAVNIGLDYDLNTTNYRFNPRSGNEFRLLTSVGIKTIDRNNEIVSLTDPVFDFATLYDTLKLKTYQVRAKLTAAHYFPIGKKSTLKSIFSGGLFGSPTIFRNELFQIGGYKLLRGFDEESIYASRYGVVTLEYRNLISLNSYLFTFMDLGWVKNNYQAVNVSNNFISGGIGLVFETKAGLLNMSFAVGKRNDVNFDLRQAAKIHFGYINYF